MTRLTVVVENTAPTATRLLGEHGLSLWVEHQGRNILYDTGMGQALLPNLATLGLDPEELDAVVLSHGHYDHTGGLEPLLGARRRPLEVWCHPGAFGRHLAQSLPGEPMREIGPPMPLKGYEVMGARPHLVSEPTEPWPGITLLAGIPRRTSFEGPSPGLVIRQGDEVLPDPFPDDLALLIDAPSGPVCLTGCAHAGVINVLLAAEERAGRPIALLLGGTHLGPAPEAQQEAALAELAQRPELRVVAGHCTGLDMAGRMAAALGPRFGYLRAGQVLDL